MRSLLLASAALMFCGPATANEASAPEAMIKDATNQVEAFLSDGVMDQSEAAEIMKLLDVDRIARFSLGRHARQVSDEDYARYCEAFSDFLTSQVMTHFEDFSGAEIKVSGSVPRSEDDVIVSTEVVRGGGDDMTINWRVVKLGDGWAVVDVEALGLWLAIEQRAQFGVILDKNNGNIDGLIDQL